MGEINFESCVSILTREIALLQKIAQAQELVRQAVLKREWADFDEKTEEARRLGADFALLEDERQRLFSSAEKTFHTFIQIFSFEEQRHLSRLYRELKMETLKMKAISDSFLAYLGEARAVAEAYIEAVCPARGGKLYTRGGRMVSQDLRSIVVNSRS